MVRLLFICCWLGIVAQVLHAQAETLPADRRYDWSVPGATTIQTSGLEVSIDDYLAGDDYDTAVADAIAALAGTGGILYFPAGTYVLTQPITLPSGVHLEGAGADVTYLSFDLNGTDHLIRAVGSLAPAVPISGGATRGATYLVVAQHSFAPGDWLRTTMSDADLVTSAWAAGSVGQVVQVAAVSDDTLWLERALRLDLPMARAPVVKRLDPVSDIGVHCLSIDRTDATDTQTSHIYLENTVDATVEGVASERGNFAHVTLVGSTRATVRHNYFARAHRYGGGGQGYGVVLQFATGDCLIENNIFEHLRHSMLLQAGTNGNVLAYNYSFDPYWTGTTLPDDAAGDLVLHGNYPFANLFEGNQVQNIVIDESHGANGPHNTFFRNRAEAYGIVMGFGALTDAQNFVANEVTGSPGLYLVSGTDHFQRANWANNKFLPTGTTPPDVVSLFRAERPAYFDAVLPDPLFGAAEPDAHGLPAMYRYAAPAARATCAPAFYAPTPNPTPTRPALHFIAPRAKKQAPWSAGPNPVQGRLHIGLDQPTGAPVIFELYDAAGRRIRRFTVTGSTTLPVSELPAGLYLLHGAGHLTRIVVE